ncbi:DNA repair protein RecO [Salaquimonas pukyongi]|uniref:DNA repair protein RecO n=1 Tax=Salaquimonas pukyongi TaxID=2712698 RepID=UPI00096BB8D1|nr:DNA repair protein RecO [Salaquimonas pukyongi]
MEWKDEGLILGVRKHGETSAIIEVMTPAHGRHMGLVRGGRSSRHRPVLQPGNSVLLEWRARLEEHLGTFTVEGQDLRAARLMELPLGIYGLQTLAAHLRLLPERDPHQGLYEAALVVLEHLDDPERAARLMIRFELAILEELGFGLDLSQCAASGSKSGLIWVSPKSGRAVGREAGLPWKEQLLPLPPFLLDEESRALIAAADGEGSAKTMASLLADGFNLSFYFLDRNVYGPRGIRPPDERAGLIRRISAAAQQAG